MHIFSKSAKRFSARGQNVQARCLLEKPLCERGHFCDQMFGTVEDEKRPLSPDMRKDGGNWILRLYRKAKGGGHGAGKQMRIADRPKVYKAHSTAKLVQQGVRNGQRDGCLAHSAGPNDGDETFSDELFADMPDRIIAPSHPRQTPGKIIDRYVERRFD